MRLPKPLKIIGVSLLVVVTLLLVSVAIFVFNPFEGSLPDMRYAVPRAVDFFVRKVDPADDFRDFPEPWFWSELQIHPDWAELKTGPMYRGINGSGQVTQALQALRDQLDEVRRQSRGWLDLMRDVAGREVQIAGRFPDGAGETAWCAYARVDWRAKFLWGLLGYTFVQEQLRQNGLQVAAEGDLYRIQPSGMPAPLFAARHLDCLFLGNDQSLVQRSWELAAGIGDPDSFGGSANYQDGIERRIKDWEQQTGVIANAIEFYVRPNELFRMPGVTFDDNWPDPHHPTDMNTRVLASFLHLSGWLGLTGALIFEEGTVSLLANLEMNQNEHTPFQSKFFQADSQDRRDWLDPFLGMVPDTACALAAMRMPAGDFLREMYNAMEEAEKSLINDALRKTGKYDSVLKLIEQVEVALHPRTGFVFRKNVPDPEIPVANPAPTPQIAWVFWIRQGGEPVLTELVELLTKYRSVIGLEQAYNLPLDLGGARVGGDAAREFTHPQLPATGSFATLIYPPFFVLSNSGPFIREMMHTMVGNRPSIRSRDDFREYVGELPNAVNGLIYVQGRELELVMRGYEQDIIAHSAGLDPAWAAQHRSSAEAEVFRRDFARNFASMAALQGADRARFDAAVDAELEKMWRTASSSYTADAKGAVRETIALCRLLQSAYMQVSLEPRYLHLTARAITSFK
jgi:hypothetical protein